jgi:hypothetical protein
MEESGVKQHKGGLYQDSPRDPSSGSFWMQCGSGTNRDIALLYAREGRNSSESQNVFEGHKALARPDYPSITA